VLSSRAEKGQGSSPPLVVWAVVALISAAFFLLSLPAFDRYRTADRVFHEASAMRLESFKARSGGAKKTLRVIAIGSSLMGKAVFIDSEMESLAKSRGLDGLEFMRLTRPAGNITGFMPLSAAIYEATPDIILVESYSALYDRNAVKNAFSRKYVAFLKAMLMESLKAGRPLLPRAEEAHAEEDFERPLLGNLALSIDSLISHWNERSLIDTDVSGPFFSGAAERGIRVVLVDIPRDPEFERRAGGPGHEEATLRKRLEEEYGAMSLRFPRAIGEKSYSDHVHLNGEGRLEFSLWLIEELKGAFGA